MKCSLGISNFLEEISSLSHSVVFLYFFALIAEEGFFISPCYSLELCIQRDISFLFSFLFYSQLFVKPSQTTILPFWISFPWGWSWSLPPVQCHEPPSIVLQALFIRFNPLNLFVISTVYVWGIWFRSYLNVLVVFSTFFNLSLNLAIRSSGSEPQSAPALVFADCIELLHLWLQRI